MKKINLVTLKNKTIKKNKKLKTVKKGYKKNISIKKNKKLKSKKNIRIKYKVNQVGGSNNLFLKINPFREDKLAECKLNLFYGYYYSKYNLLENYYRYFTDNLKENNTELGKLIRTLFYINKEGPDEFIIRIDYDSDKLNSNNLCFFITYFYLLYIFYKYIILNLNNEDQKAKILYNKIAKTEISRINTINDINIEKISTFIMNKLNEFYKKINQKEKKHIKKIKTIFINKIKNTVLSYIDTNNSEKNSEKNELYNELDLNIMFHSLLYIVANQITSNEKKYEYYNLLLQLVHYFGKYLEEYNYIIPNDFENLYSNLLHEDNLNINEGVVSLNLLYRDLVINELQSMNEQIKTLLDDYNRLFYYSMENNLWNPPLTGDMEIKHEYGNKVYKHINCGENTLLKFISILISNKDYSFNIEKLIALNPKKLDGGKDIISFFEKYKNMNYIVEGIKEGKNKQQIAIEWGNLIADLNKPDNTNNTKVLYRHNKHNNHEIEFASNITGNNFLKMIKKIFELDNINNWEEFINFLNEHDKFPNVKLEYIKPLSNSIKLQKFKIKIIKFNTEFILKIGEHHQALDIYNTTSNEFIYNFKHYNYNLDRIIILKNLNKLSILSLKQQKTNIVEDLNNKEILYLLYFQNTTIKINEFLKNYEFPNIKQLELQNYINNNLLKLNKLTKLYELDLPTIKNNIILQVIKINSLIYKLTLTNNMIFDLREYKNLKVLFIRNNDKYDNDIFFPISLEDLNLFYYTKMENLPKNYKELINLKKFYISNNYLKKLCQEIGCKKKSMVLNDEEKINFKNYFEIPKKNYDLEIIRNLSRPYLKIPKTIT